jgi:hypothetical protein
MDNVEGIIYSFIFFMISSCCGWGILVSNPSPAQFVLGIHLILLSFVLLFLLYKSIKEE